MNQEWHLIPGFEGRYEINVAGQVRSVVDINRQTGRKPSGKILNSKIGLGGYYIVALRPPKARQRSYAIHRLLALTFLPNPDNKPCINHINSVRTDNRLENLEWCTYSENNSHAHRVGGQRKYVGEFHSQSKLTWEKVNGIRSKYATGQYTIKQLCAEYSASVGCVYAIIKNKTWKQSEQAA